MVTKRDFFLRYMGAAKLRKKIENYITFSCIQVVTSFTKLFHDCTITFPTASNCSSFHTESLTFLNENLYKNKRTKMSRLSIIAIYGNA